MSQPPRKRSARKRAAASEAVVESKSLAVPESPWRSMLNFIASAMERKDYDVEKLQVLIGLQDKYLADEARALFTQAFIPMQAEMPVIKKNGLLEYPVDKAKPQGPKYKVANFAKWEDIDRGIRPIYTKHGFRLNFRIAPRTGDGGGLLVTAILEHAAGHREEAEIPMPLETGGGMNNQQRYGSALSYGKKYAAFAVLNIVTEGDDDDASAAGQVFILPEQAQELRDLCAEVGREEANILRRLFSDTVASFDELEQGTPFLAAKNMLLGIRQMQQQRGGGAE